ncbi:MAG: amidase [Pseudomonadota bacterium]|nr:amidase [Pseudomonadota bacterium]
MTPEDYLAHDATGLAALVAAGETTPDALLAAALTLAETRGPAVNALTNLVPQAARDAIMAGLPRGPLHGVPFLLKDMDAAALGVPSHDGSRLTRATRHGHDSELVGRLRRAGLNFFGRTTAPEGGIGVTTEAAVYGGPTRNPWDLGRTSGGSSGGAAAAVAAGITPAAHGSDGGGSVRIPAASCGLVGFKCSRGRLPDGPTAGEGWGGMATAGFLTRSVRDQAALLDLVAGPDLGAPYVAPPMEGSFAQALARPPRRLRVALCLTDYEGAPIHPDHRAAVEAAGRLMESLGHAVEEARPDADQRAMIRAWSDIVACGTWAWVRAEARAQGLEGDGLSLLEPVARGACRHAMTLSGADYLAALNHVHAFGRRMAAFYAGGQAGRETGGGCDVLVSATLAEPPAEIGRFAHARPEFEDFLAYRLGEGGCYAYSPFTVAANAAGQPAMSLPLGTGPAGGMPVGIHISAPAGADAELMALAGELEAAAPWADRRAPFPFRDGADL